jgi:hypothetical protein
MRKTYGRLGAIALGVSLLAAAAGPAEAQFRLGAGPTVGLGFGRSSVGGALGAGLVGGLALGLLAHAQRQQAGLAYVPEAYIGPEDEVVEEVWRAPRTIRPGPARRDFRRVPTRVKSPATPAPSRRPSAAIDACSSAIVKASKAYGDTRVSAAGAGPVVQDQQGRSVSVNARIEYRLGNRTEVRRARVNCRLGPDGNVVAIR